ncbi:MAG: DUF4091 domain-containing protein [Clostridia bacterium]|nr:DUF4091 domain-containing protein [Clostridia bacterium]
MKRFLSLILSAAMCIGIGGAFASIPADAEVPVLAEGSTLILDDESGYVTRIPLGTTKAELVSEFTAGTAVTVEKDGAALADSDTVSSGCKAIVGDKTYVCAVSGDVNGDGKIALADVSAILMHLANWTADIHVPAIDVNLDGKVNLADGAHLLKYIAKWDVYVGTFEVKYNEDRIEAEDEDNSLSLSVLDNMQKIDRRDTAIGNSATLLMNLSRNEIESCQIMLASKGGHEDLRISYTPFGNGIGDTIETVMTMHHYVSTESVNDPSTKVQYPDALIPLTQFDIKDNYSQGFLLKIKPDKDAKPGLYMSKVTVRDNTGKIIKVAQVYANVWDLTLPDSSSCATAFGLTSYGVYTTHQQYDGDDGELMVNYYEYLLENRISAYYLPYSFEDPRFEDYMNDPRVTSFCVTGCQQGPNGDLTDEQLAELYEKYGDNENWNKKAYFYYVDEPNSPEAIATLRYAHERLEKYVPNARHVTPIVTNPWYGEKDQVEIVSELTNLWCPISSFYTPYELNGDNTFLSSTRTRVLGTMSIDKYGTAEERFSAYKAAGDELWWYVCVIPQYPYANFFTNYQGEWSRVLFWQQYMYDIDGCLYWATNYWNNGAEWRTSDNDFYSGDGLLIYSGHRYGIYGPIGCLRMEYIRDGIEDFEYLTMAEELYGREEVAKVLSKVTTGVLEYTKDSKVIEAAKIELAQMIMDGLEK